MKHKCCCLSEIFFNSRVNSILLLCVGIQVNMNRLDVGEDFKEFVNLLSIVKSLKVGFYETSVCWELKFDRLFSSLSHLFVYDIDVVFIDVD